MCHEYMATIWKVLCRLVQKRRAVIFDTGGSVVARSLDVLAVCKYTVLCNSLEHMQRNAVR